MLQNCPWHPAELQGSGQQLAPDSSWHLSREAPLPLAPSPALSEVLCHLLSTALPSPLPTCYHALPQPQTQPGHTSHALPPDN